MRNSILPYVYLDGVPTFKDSHLKEIFVRMMEQGYVERVFYDGSVQSPDEFVEFFKRPDRHLHVFMGDIPLSLFWVDQIEHKSCRLHFCGLKEAGRDVISMGKEAINLLSEHFLLIHGEILESNKSACRFVQKCGGELMGVMPNKLYNYYKDEMEDAVLFYYNKGEII